MAVSAVSSVPYTYGAQVGAEEVVAAHLARIVEAITCRVRFVESIILTGSFGRGEGGVLYREGRFQPQNDYDLIVVTRKRERSATIRGLGNDLARELGIDYVDIGLLSWSKLGELPPTMFNYDLLKGGRVVYGNPQALDLIPVIGILEIPVDEALVLLLNRCAGVLTAVDGVPALVPPTDTRYLRNQLTKMALACGDSFLLATGKYCSSVAERAALLADSPALPWAANETWARAVREAYQVKLSPGLSHSWSAEDHLKAVAGLALFMVNYVARSVLAGVNWGDSVQELAGALCRHWRYQDCRLSPATKLRIWRRLQRRRLLFHFVVPGLPFAARVHAALIIIFSTLLAPDPQMMDVCQSLVRVSGMPGEKRREDGRWREVREAVLEAWALTSH